MQKAEVQHDCAQKQSVPRQGGGIAWASPQGGRIAQLDAMAEASLQSGRLAQLAAAAAGSPKALAQRGMIDTIHNSPRTTLQCEAIGSIGRGVKNNGILPGLVDTRSGYAEAKVSSTQTAIQRYIADARFPSEKISNNWRYLTSDSNNDGSQLLGVNTDGATPPAPIDFFEEGNTEAHFGADWRIFRSRASFQGAPPDGGAEQQYAGPNDCGYYAGALAAQTPNWRDGAAMGAMRDTLTGNAVGNPDTREMTLQDQGDHAAPGLGDAYFIFPPPGVQNPVANHHVATVVATDGGDRITSEADCSDDRPRGYFKMYGTEDATQTFLAQHGRYFSGPDSRARVATLGLPRLAVPAAAEDDVAAGGLGHVPMDVEGDGVGADAMEVPMDLEGDGIVGDPTEVPMELEGGGIVGDSTEVPMDVDGDGVGADWADVPMNLEDDGV